MCQNPFHKFVYVINLAFYENVSFLKLFLPPQLQNAPIFPVKQKFKMTYVKKLQKPVVYLILLVKTFLSNATNITLELSKSETEGFQCYQCMSDSRDFKPLCDTSFFKLTRPEERWFMLVQCPRNRRDYCMKKVVIETDYVRTSRGCSNLYDNTGNRLKLGCIAMHSDAEVTLCICDQSKCNSGAKIVCNLVSFIFSWVLINRIVINQFK